MITKDTLITTICIAMDREAIKMTPEDMLSRSRLSSNVLARSLFCFVGRQYVGWTFEQLAKHLRLKSHSTCVHAERVAIDLIETDGQVGRTYRHICWLLNLQPPDWLHVNTFDPQRVELRETKVGRKVVQLPDTVVNKPVKTHEWTAEQKKLLKMHRREPGVALPEKFGMN